MSSKGSTSSASGAPTRGIVRIPTYESLPQALIQGLQDASAATMLSTDDLFNCTQPTKVILAEVRPNSIILIPLFGTPPGVLMDSTALASGPAVYVKLNGSPQPRACFGVCVAYSEGTGTQDLEIGALIQFPPPSHLLVAIPTMVELIGATIGTALDNPRTTDQLVTKRLCVRPPSGLGERTDRTHEYGGEKVCQRNKCMTLIVEVTIFATKQIS
jgi:hypothetical protein